MYPSAQNEYFCASIITILMESGKQPGSVRYYLDRVNRTPNQRITSASTVYPSLNIQTCLTCRSVQGLEGIDFLIILSWSFEIFGRTASVWSTNFFVYLPIYVSKICIISKSSFSSSLWSSVVQGLLFSVGLFLQHSMRQVTMVYFDPPLAPFHASTCIALWDFLHQLIFHSLRYKHIYFCQQVAFE